MSTTAELKVDVITRRIKKCSSSQIIKKIEANAFTAEELPIAIDVLNSRGIDSSNYSEKVVVTEEKVSSVIEEEIYIPSEDTISKEKIQEVEDVMDIVITGNDTPRLKLIMPIVSEKDYDELNEKEAAEIIRICTCPIEDLYPKSNSIGKEEKNEDRNAIKEVSPKATPRPGSKSEAILSTLLQHPEMPLSKVAALHETYYPMVARVKKNYVS